MAVRDLSAGQAARWIAERFQVPELPPGTHLAQPKRLIFEFGKESDIGVLVQSGLWAELSAAARSIIPVLLELAERVPGSQNLKILISYRAIARFSGLASPNAIRDALKELQAIFWLRAFRQPAGAGSRAAPRHRDLPDYSKVRRAYGTRSRALRRDASRNRHPKGSSS